MNLLYIFILCCLSVSCVSPRYNKNKIVQVYDEPKHKLVFKKGEVKILDVQIMPHDTTQFHIHSNPMFFVSLGWQKDAGQQLNAKWSEYEPEWPSGEIDSDTTYSSKPIIHRSTNGGNTLSHLIGIVNTGKGMNSSYNSDGYEVANRWFRSKRIVLNFGDTVNIPKSNFPVVLVIISGSQLLVVQDKMSKIYDTKWIYLQGKHTLINPSNDELKIIQIEMLN
jgi:hypothetical protein